MTDYIPKLSHEDVQRIVVRDYPAEDHDQILKMLAEYGPDQWHRETQRVRVAILKEAKGITANVRSRVEIAKCDYRDVVGCAEYPKQMAVGFGIGDEKRQQLQAEDWQQYQEWLNRKLA